MIINLLISYSNRSSESRLAWGRRGEGNREEIHKVLVQQAAVVKNKMRKTKKQDQRLRIKEDTCARDGKNLACLQCITIDVSLCLFFVFFYRSSHNIEERVNIVLCILGGNGVL